MNLVTLIAENLVEYETLTKEQIDYLVSHGKMKELDISDDSDTDNNDLTLEELKDIAKEKGIKGYSKMNKNDLKKELGM